MVAEKTVALDQMDELIRQFRPIEQLFRVWGAVGDAECDAETIRSFSTFGLSLTESFRACLDQAFQNGGDDSGDGHMSTRR